MTALAEFGIVLRRETPGEHRAPCPECARTKQRRGDDALAVRIEPDGGGTWLCHRCGWAGGFGPERREAVAKRPLRRLRHPPPEPEPDPQAERNRERAQEVWRQAGSVPLGGIARAYLVERRRITTWDPDRLRWHPECPWRGGTAGCLVAPVNAAVGGLVVGVWRIRPVLAGEVERRALGPMGGNCSRLVQADGPVLAITEGAEDALAYHELSGVPAWAALCAGNMAQLALPERFREVHVVADADPVGMEKAAELVRRMRAEGREARLIKPLHHKEANDVLRARRTSA